MGFAGTEGRCLTAAGRGTGDIVRLGCAPAGAGVDVAPHLLEEKLSQGLQNPDRPQPPGNDEHNKVERSAKLFA